MIFGYPVRDPERYGVVTFDRFGKPTSLEEKPTRPRSIYAVPGLYFYDREAGELAARLKPSPRGELEITELNRLYLERGRLQLRLLGRGVAWFDTGTHESLLQAASFIETIELRQGVKIACLEEVAFREGWIDQAQVEAVAATLRNNTYGQYLLSMLRQFQTEEGLRDYRFGSRA